MKKLIIIGSSGFVGKSLNDFFKKKKKIKLLNYSRTEGKNILNIKKLPRTDYIIYCINNKNIKKSLNYFFYFKKLLKKSYKNNYKKFSGYKKNYSKEKYVLENEFKKIAKEGFKVSIARGFTFYGKHILNYNYLISKLIQAIKTKKKFKIYNPYIIRSYMHSDDMCRWLMKIIDNSSNKCPVVNLGCDKIIDIKKFASFLNEKFDADISINEKSIKKIDFYVPSINYAKKYLKLKNTVNFNNAITSLIK